MPAKTKQAETDRARKMRELKDKLGAKRAKAGGYRGDALKEVEIIREDLAGVVKLLGALGARDYEAIREQVGTVAAAVESLRYWVRSAEVQDFEADCVAEIIADPEALEEALADMR